MKQKICAFILTVLTLGGFMMVMTPAPAMALGGSSCGAPTLFGFKAWYSGLCNSKNEVDQPKSQDDTVQFVWTVVLNILFDLFLAVGYLALGFVIYGGFLYMTAQGDPGKALRGQKTLTAAVIGTVITMIATVAVNTIKTVLGITNTNWKQDINPQEAVANAFNWVYTVAGILAVVFLIKAGVEYIISRGDPGKTQKAMRSIAYSLIGLVIVLLAAVITNFVVGATGTAMQETSLIEDQYEEILG